MKNFSRPNIFKKITFNKRKILWIVFVVGLLTILFVITVNCVILRAGKKHLATVTTAPTADAILILGARVYTGGTLSGMLQDRVDTALELYQRGVAQKILVSGDHGQKNYDEVNAIKDYLLAHDVPPQNIFLDHAGFSTYDSLYRARAIFEIKTLVVATQNFHLPRAVYIGNKLGIATTGVSADKHYYKNEFLNGWREWPARVKAWFAVLFKVKPKFLGPTIPITGSSAPSWDM